MYRNDQRNDKIKQQLDQIEDKVVNDTNGDFRNLILRLIDNAILPRGGDRNEIHKEAKIHLPLAVPPPRRRGPTALPPIALAAALELWQSPSSPATPPPSPPTTPTR